MLCEATGVALTMYCPTIDLSIVSLLAVNILNLFSSRNPRLLITIKSTTFGFRLSIAGSL
jgi:hypothetical protein